MSNIYIFSQNNFNVVTDDEQHQINEYCYIKLQNYANEMINITDNNNLIKQSCKIKFDTNSLLPNIRLSKIENNKFCEIIHLENQQALQELKIKSAKIILYGSALNIVYDNKVFCYYFCCDKQNYAIEQDDKICIFNKYQVVEFDKNNLAFCLKKCEKIVKNNKKIEILCQIPKNNVYFMLYVFDLEANEIATKQYKKEHSLDINEYALPIIFFELCKNGFDDAKSYISNSIDFESIKKYFNNFDNIVEIDQKYYLTSHKEVCPVNFKIDNNIIYDID